MKFSVIIAAYNCENTIKNTLSSLVDQDYKEYEVIVVNDKSTDKTLSVIDSYKSRIENLKVISLEFNSGPGIARNKAFEYVQGEYILVLDSDDELRPGAMKLLELKINHNSCDIYKFNHIYNNGKRMFNNEKQLYRVGEHKDVDTEFLATDNFYMWGRIYKTSFIKDNNIRCSEGILYEDIEFVTKAYLMAEKVEVMNDTLLICNVVKSSATRVKKDTTIHMESLYQAIVIYFRDINYNDEIVKSHVWCNLAHKLNSYIVIKCPNDKKEYYYNLILNLLNDNKPKIYIEHMKINELVFKIEAGVIKEYNDFKTQRSINSFNVNKSIGLAKYINNFLFLCILKLFFPNKQKFTYVRFFDNRKHKNIILFQGFDYNFVGNSKYKFLEELRTNSTDKIYFVTNSLEVPKENRIEMHSLQHFYLLAKARIIYLESYQEPLFQKGNKTKLIQLWHGTPIKKLVLDSCNEEFVKLNENYIEEKLNQINAWDELYAENSWSASKLASAFNYKKEIKIENYARVNYLLKYKDDKSLRAYLHNKHNIPNDKPVALYVPTWRDREGNPNEYLLDSHIIMRLKEQYHIIYSPHKYKEFTIYNELKRFDYINNNIDLQELILISDICISDYSSIIFDFIHINKKVILYQKDYKQYNEYRGIYEDFTIYNKDNIYYKY